MFLDSKDRILVISSLVKLLLTVIQIIMGLYSNSMALIADALHNFADCSVLVIALIARMVARKPPDIYKTFGYKKIELVAALINFTTIIVVGIYLIVEAVGRIFSSDIINGSVVIFTAVIAFTVNIVIAFFLFHISKENLNLKAVFLDTVSDTLGAIAVLISGILIYYYNIASADTITSILIAVYIIYNSAVHIPKVANILLGAKPDHLNLAELCTTLEAVEGVINIHHLHVWQLDEVQQALEAHVVIENLEDMERLKQELKSILRAKYHIDHSTLEFEKYQPGFEKDSCYDIKCDH